MREAIHFTFDGVSSEDMGVHIASPSGGLYEETFLPKRSIVEQTVAKKYKPYFQRVELEPLSFSFSFFIEEWRERDNLRTIAKWLFQPYYKPLILDTNQNRVFYVMVEGDSSLIHNGCKDGYVTLTFRCNSPFTYSPKQVVEWVSNKNSRTTILNEGDMAIKPKIWITKRVGKGSITITNNSNGQKVKLDNLQLDEEVFIDFENEEIVSSLEYLNVFRYADHNGTWLELIEGDNDLLFTGHFDIQIEFEQIYLTD